MYECFLEIAFEAELDTKEDPECLAIAHEQCKENPATRSAAVRELRELLYERGVCQPHRTDDAFLLRFLRARNFIVPRAHKLVDTTGAPIAGNKHQCANITVFEFEWYVTGVATKKLMSQGDENDEGCHVIGRRINYHQLVRYCNFRLEYPHLYEGVDLWGLSKVKDAYEGSMLDRPDVGRLSIFRFGTWDPSEFPVEDLVRAGMAMTEIGIRQPKIQVLGGTVIVDLEGVTLRHVASLTPTIAYQIVCLMGVAIPARLNSCHIVNYNWLLNSFFYVFKRFIPQQTWSRIHFHGHDLGSLHRRVDPACLPRRYGGTCRNHVSIGQWFQKIKKYRDAQFDTEMKALGYLVKE